ncbi:MAG TPA: VCBS repeat-containing protein, partial [Rhodothermales bacterium]|nr:VCBS repeat-containing protein [Rhodothermales bacterium]
MSKPIAPPSIGALAFLIGFATFMLSGCSEPERQTVYRPENVADTTQLTRRQEMQRAAADDINVFHDFSFTDRLDASSIDFSHKIVDDAGIAYKMVHYDHGNGLSIADVDNDGFSDIYFINQVGANELWRNLGDGAFENITQAAGVGLDSIVCVTSSFADVDNDGDQDLFVTAVREGNFLFENDGTGTFTDISDAAGLKFSAHSSGAVFFDYDRDGLLDLFLTNVGQYSTGERVPIEGRTRFDDQEGAYYYYAGFADSSMGKLIPERDEINVLYKNDGDNRFVDVTSEMGVAGSGWSGDAVSWDVNEDGWPDLYVLSMNGDDEYYENVEGQRFELKTVERFRGTPFGSMGVTTFDYNRDGPIDLYLTDMHSDMWETNRYISVVQEKERPDRVLPIQQQGEAINIFGNAL